MSTPTPSRTGTARPGPRQPGRPQPRWLVVAGREIAVKLHDKNFIGSTVLTLAMMALAIGLNVYLAGRIDHSDIAVDSAEGAALVQAAQTADVPGSSDSVEFTADRQPDAAAVEDRVRSGDADAGLVHGPQGWTLVGKDDVDDAVTTRIGAAVAAQTLDERARAAGTSVEALTAGTRVEQRTLDSTGVPTAAKYLAGIAFAMLFYMAAMLFGYSIAGSVVEEKQSRVVEILAAAMPLRDLLVGKVLGATVLALGQMALLVGIGLVGLSFTDYSAVLTQLGPAAAWYLVFFVVGFVALASMYAVAGAMATRSEDVQSTSAPMLTLVMIATFGGMFAEGTARTVLSYVPIASTVSMPIRLFSGDAQWWEALLALAVAVVFAVVVVRFAERVYRRSVMQTRGKLGWREALRLAD